MTKREMIMEIRLYNIYNISKELHMKNQHIKT